VGLQATLDSFEHFIGGGQNFMRPESMRRADQPITFEVGQYRGSLPEVQLKTMLKHYG
jgi:hypothetical protein